MAKVTNEHKSAPWIIMDVETSGREPKKHGLTEIAMMAIRGDTLEEIGRYESLIKPYSYEVEEEATKITGLNEAKLEKEGKDIEIVGAEVIKFLEDANIFNNTGQHKPILVAHNATFEGKWLQHLFDKIKKKDKIDKLLQCNEDYYGNMQPVYVDTMQLARMLFAANIRVKSMSLEVTCESLGVALADGHRAMHDVIPTSEVLKQSIKMLRSAQTGVANTDVDAQLSFRSGFQFEF